MAALSAVFELVSAICDDKTECQRVLRRSDWSAEQCRSSSECGS